ncbi:MAG: hypothetical protein GY847_35230 [Proteobacteria bacterium]|nr:hypothetical protein [Pseudomonadota bacterium]
MTVTIRKCIDDKVLSAYIDEDLNQEHTAEVTTHLATCSECKQIVTDLKILKTDLARSFHVRPKRNLWPVIDKKLSSDWEGVSMARLWLPRLLPIPLAAAAVLSLVLLQRPDEQSPVPPLPSATELDRAITTVQQAEMAYLNAIVSLERVLENEKASFSPKTLKIVEQSLAEIETAIERCRKAILRDPSNMEANRAMLAAYRQKMDFLYELVGSRIRPKGA